MKKILLLLTLITAFHAIPLKAKPSGWRKKVVIGATILGGIAASLAFLYAIDNLIESQSEKIDYLKTDALKKQKIYNNADTILAGAKYDFLQKLVLNPSAEDSSTINHSLNYYGDDQLNSLRLRAFESAQKLLNAETDYNWELKKYIAGLFIIPACVSIAISKATQYVLATSPDEEAITEPIQNYCV